MYFTVQEFNQHIHNHGISPLSVELNKLFTDLEISLDVATIESSIKQLNSSSHSGHFNNSGHPSGHSTHSKYINYTYKKETDKPEMANSPFSSLKKDRHIIQKEKYGNQDATFQSKPSSNGNKLNEKWVKNAETMEKIKITKIEKKEGIDKTNGEIRIHLNKITKKNYETQRDKIFVLIDNVIELSNQEAAVSAEIAAIENEMATAATPAPPFIITTETLPLNNLQKIAQFIFDISSSNKFFCELYANLYNELIVKYNDIFIHILNEFIHNFKDSIQHFCFCDPDEDYEKYCAFVKESDKKKAITTFIVMMLNRGVVTTGLVVELAGFFKDKIKGFIDESNKINEIEELGEIIYILISLGNEKITKPQPTADIGAREWQTVIDDITIFTTLKVKEHKSLSSRFIFKMRDLMQCLSTP
jgi:hypothetical protein